MISNKGHQTTTSAVMHETAQHVTHGSTTETRTHIELVSRPEAIINADCCKACGLCIAFCPRGVLVQGDKINVLGYRATEYSGEGCIGCGACFYACPEPNAVMVVKKTSEVLHLRIDQPK